MMVASMGLWIQPHSDIEKEIPKMQKNNHILFGGLGFIGQNLAARLLTDGHKVLIIDKDQWQIGIAFKTLLTNENCKIFREDINRDVEGIIECIQDFLGDGHNTSIWHLAANSDIMAGNSNIEVDLNDTFLTTINILKICEKLNLKSLNFSSSSAVYGNSENNINGFAEDSATNPISNYGAMKLASEAVIRSAYQKYLDKCLIFRFPNVIGVPATHGVIKDFILKLKKNPKVLVVLGDGNQNKPYLHVSDLVDAMLHLHVHYQAPRFLEVINIGSPYENVFVKEIARQVCNLVSPKADIIYGSTPYGWLGDMPQVWFDIRKLLSTGWSCRLSGKDAVRMTIQEILEETPNDNF